MIAENEKRLMTKKRLQEEIKRITKQIVQHYRPQKVILFGSAARGEFGEDSDVDMLIIKETPERRVDRIKKVLLAADYSFPLEPLVYTPAELEERKRLGDSFILEVLKQGKVLYERKH